MRLYWTGVSYEHLESGGAGARRIGRRGGPGGGRDLRGTRHAGEPVRFHPMAGRSSEGRQSRDAGGGVEGRLRRRAYRGVAVPRIWFGGGEERERADARIAPGGQVGRSVFEARREQRFARGGLPAEGLAAAGGARRDDAGRDGARPERGHAGRQSGDVEGRRPGDLPVDLE